MKKILLLFALLISCNVLFAQKSEWELIAEGVDSTMYYYKPNTKNTAWIKVVEEKNKNVEYLINLYQFDCDERKIGVVQVVSYKNGKVLNSTTLKSYEIEMRYVVPESIGETLLLYFCHD